MITDLADLSVISIALGLGFFSTLHCWGMCGGIITALTYSLPADARVNHTKLLAYSFAFNLGRICSYTLAGFLAGAVGTVFVISTQGYGLMVLQMLAGIVLVLAGVRLAGWHAFPFTWLERLGAAGWRHLQPLGRRLIPVDHPGKAWLMGMVWGWLPCGLVYSALLLAASTAGSGTGGLTMLAFGLGTLPGMVLAGVAGARAQDWLRRSGLRVTAAVILISLGVALPLLHQTHLHQTQGHATHLHQH